MGKRRAFAVEVKFQVVLDVLGSHKSNAEVCRKYNLAPAQHLGTGHLALPTHWALAFDERVLDNLGWHDRNTEHFAGALHRAPAQGAAALTAAVDSMDHLLLRGHPFPHRVMGQLLARCVLGTGKLLLLPETVGRGKTAWRAALSLQSGNPLPQTGILRLKLGVLLGQLTQQILQDANLFTYLSMITCGQYDNSSPQIWKITQ